VIHNVPLRVLWETGGLGLLAWLWIMGYGFWEMWKHQKWMLGAWMAMGALMLIDHQFWSSQMGLWTWVVLGLSCQVQRPDDLSGHADQ
jgi:hypothetical protein